MTSLSTPRASNADGGCTTAGPSGPTEGIVRCAHRDRRIATGWEKDCPANRTALRTNDTVHTVG